jgi:c-di-GMP-binding flagellar brake protein YcgR
VERLRETQRVGLGIGQYSVDCAVVALESDEAALLPLGVGSAERLPVFSRRGTLVFTDRAGAIVMLRGVIRHDDADDLLFFSVSDGVGRRSVRRASRARIVLPVTVTPEGGQPLRGTTSDLSAGGVGARVEDPGPPDTRVTVSLELGDGAEPLECEAIVVRRVGPVSALRFDALTQVQERRIHRRVLAALRRRAELAA